MFGEERVQRLGFRCLAFEVTVAERDFPIVLFAFLDLL